MMDFAKLEPERKPFWKSRSFIAVAVLVVLSIVMVGVIIGVSLKKPREKHEFLVPNINAAQIMEHLNAFQDIATQHNGSRTAVTGYNASADYVFQKLQGLSEFEVTMQRFNYEFFSVITTPTMGIFTPTGVRSVGYGVEFGLLRYSGSGSINGTVNYVAGACNSTEFSSFTAGNIALIDRNGLNDCSMVQKVNNSINRGAIGIVVAADSALTGLFSAGLSHLQQIPMFTVTFNMGQTLTELAQLNDLRLMMISSTEAPSVSTLNVLATTTGGAKDKPKIVVGAHLDGVLAGPGINDNGSGSATILEMALQIVRQKITFENRIMFAWWAGEEYGLLGSKNYVSSLDQNGINDIALNLNFDMLGSPNYFRGIYDGQNAQLESIRKASGKIQKTFVDYFTYNELAWDLTPFNGRSDYGPFIEVGIPAGGLFSGAEEVKNDAGRLKYGGFANTAYDPCYHQSCDTTANIDQEGLQSMARCAAYTTAVLADKENLSDWLQE